MYKELNIPRETNVVRKQKTHRRIGQKENNILKENLGL